MSVSRLRAVGLRYWPWVAIPVLAIPAFWGYAAGFPASADGFLHLLRTALLDTSIRQGILYPRWLPELVMGFGYPVFNFYGPTTYYLAEGLHLLGLGFYQALMGAFVVIVVAGGYGMYLLAAAIFGEQAGPWAPLVAAVAYMYAPYTLVNVFVRGAIGEVGAQALLPWIFWSFNRLLTQPRPGRWLLPAALSLGALPCTHNITLLFLPPALLAYLAMLWWQGSRSRPQLAWAGAGLVGAMGAGAFFWLPVLGERADLANTAYQVARQLIAGNSWTWRNFLSTSLVYGYTADVPFRLGLVQLALAVAGFVLARRRDAEWFYWLVLAVVAGIGIGSWTLPIWLSSDILLAAQYPWRLLVLVTVPLALFAGGCLSRVVSPVWRGLGGVALLAVIIVANQPHLGSGSTAPIDNTAINLPAITQFETLTEALGTSSAQEFMPRWAQFAPLDTSSTVTNSLAAPTFKAIAGGPLERVVEVTAAAPFALRFADFYYPGWRAFIDAGQPLAEYPSTNLGLLTVDVPAGTHQVRVVWQGTALEQWATVISLATLLALAVFQLRQPRDRWAAAVPAVLLAFGALVAFKPLPAPGAIAAPSATFDQANLRLLGDRFDQPNAGELYLYPYWQVEQQPAPLRAHWRLTDAGGKLVSEIDLPPYFGGGHTDSWPADTLVDDAYAFPLPPGMPAGNYDLSLQLEPLSEPPTDSGPNNKLIARLTLGAVPASEPARPAQTIDARFGASIDLAGYDFRLNQKPADAMSRPPVRPGDELDYTLYWKALGSIAENDHGYIHLVDAHQNPIAKSDHLPGTWFHPPVLWDPFHMQADTYQLTIPRDAPGGLYWPRLGLYHSPDLTSVPIHDATGKALGDSLDLPPVKVVPPAPRPPDHLTSARFDDLATLWGYTLNLPPGGLRTGTTFTLTLFYRSTGPGSVDYTHFVHLFGADGQMAVQDDAQPQRGVNPTSAWVADEVIVDPIVLTVAAGTPAGNYTLATGLYDPAAGGARLAALDDAGNEMQDDTVILTTLAVGP
jgi:hypothetical protein